MNITAEGTLHLYDVAMRYLGIKVGISLLSIRSSDIAFTMGQKTLFWKKRHCIMVRSRNFEMLKYEEKLRLDEQWEKLSAGKCKSMLSPFSLTAFYVAALLLIRWLRFGWAKPSLSDGAFYIIGLIVFLYGSIRFMKINRENHAVRGKKNTPSALLTDGVYAKVRHPMYGSFVICAVAFLLPMQSWLGAFLSVLFAAFQYANAVIEERRKLIPLFGEEYLVYRQKTPRLLLKTWEAVVLFVLLATSIIMLCI